MSKKTDPKRDRSYAAFKKTQRDLLREAAAHRTLHDHQREQFRELWRPGVLVAIPPLTRSPDQPSPGQVVLAVDDAIWNALQASRRN